MSERVRVDKWLWAARFFKTRSQATEAVAGGRVHLAGQRIKPSRDVGVGDRLTITAAHGTFEVVLIGLGERRGSAAAAALLYEETPESRERRARERELARLAPPLGADLQGGRPTGRDRRRLEAQRRASGRGPAPRS